MRRNKNHQLRFCAGSTFTTEQFPQIRDVHQTWDPFYSLRCVSSHQATHNKDLIVLEYHFSIDFASIKRGGRDSSGGNI